MDPRANSAINVESFTATDKEQGQAARAAAADVEEWYNHLHSPITILSISTAASVAILQFEPRYSLTIAVVWMETEEDTHEEITTARVAEEAAGTTTRSRARRTREAA